MRNVMYVSMVLALAGCVTATPVSLPNGTQGFALHCNGAARDISSCMNKAAEVCGGAYHVIDRDSENAGGAYTAMGNGGVYVHGIHRTMIVGCGAN